MSDPALSDAELLTQICRIIGPPAHVPAEGDQPESLNPGLLPELVRTLVLQSVLLP